MWVTISKTEKKEKKREKRKNRKEQKRKKQRHSSVRIKIAATFTVFAVFLLLILNIYPILASRDMVFSTKQSTMESQGLVISSSLSALEGLSEESVAQVMDLLDVTAMTRIIITDPAGLILYDTSESDEAVGRYALLTEITVALGGSITFSCDYSGDIFISRAAVPVVSGGNILGAVYLYEYDAEQGSILHGLQQNLLTMSFVFAVGGLIIIFVISTTLTRRIKRLTAAIGVVSSGDYAYRIKVQGTDEIAALSSEFNVLTGRLESTEEARRRFVSDASHELRTPLAAIRLLSDSITQTDNMDGSTMREFAADIGAEAERLQRITENLMNLTKLDSGVTQAKQEAVDMKEVAKRTMHLLSPLAAQQNVSLVTNLSENCIITASSDDIYQIIFNLVENGIKYNVPNGSVFLSLCREKPFAVLTVSDTGIGIPEEDMANIFDRFYRVDKARSRASGGSGLGLAIVHDAVTANGGQIQVSRRPDGGTVFRVTFLLSHRKEKHK